jgi:exoribonuclease-2
VQRPGEPGLGHFGLAVPDYTHSTAPNRRYADLVVQRLVKAALAGDVPPYTADELEPIALRCTQREDAAKTVERLVGKQAAAAVLGPRLGESFDAVITGVKPGAVFARLLDPPVEGRVVRGEAGLDVGDHARLRLLEVDVRDGFIDFARE